MSAFAAIFGSMLSVSIVHAEELTEAKLTCYCGPAFPEGSMTASGTPVRYGVIASTREHLGDGALVWTYDEEAEGHQGEFIGYFCCEDIGGTEAINKGWVIDLYVPTLDEVKEMTIRTGGRVVVQYVTEPRG